MITEERMKEVVMEKACELAGEFAKKVAIDHMKHAFQGGLMARYVSVANSENKNLNEEGCLKKGGFELGDSYKALVVKGINSIDLDGDIVEGFQVVKWGDNRE